MNTKNWLTGTFAALIVTAGLTACGHPSHPGAVAPAQAPSTHRSAGAVQRGTQTSGSSSTHSSQGSSGTYPSRDDGGSTPTVGTPVPDPANTLGVPELPQYDPDRAQLNAIQDQ